MKCIKYVVTFWTLGFMSLCFAEVTLDSILDQELVGTELAETLPYRNTSTPEKAILGYLRATAGTSLRDDVFWLTPDEREIQHGIRGVEEISDTQENEFSQAANECGWYSFRLKSYQIVTNGDAVFIDAVTSFITKTATNALERHLLRATQIDGEWKFDQVETRSAY